MAEFSKPKGPKEIDVFNRFSQFNKLKIILIAVIITLVVGTGVYFFAKSVSIYTVSYETNGGLVFGEELKDDKYHFLEKTKEPENLRKRGYFLEGYYKDKNFTDRYEFGRAIWKSVDLYVNWQPGYAVQLFFAEGEESKSSMTEEYLKLYHEQYVEQGSEYTLPLVYNDIEGDEHYGEQLLWYENPECTGDPIEIKTYVVSDNIQIYGKWFDTSAEKFDVSSEGTLTRYLGVCDKVILPNNIVKIKDIDYNAFNDEKWNTTNTADGSVFSAFDKVLKELELVYINKECVELGACAFRGAESLENVYFLGNNVTRIGSYAFAFCKQLESVSVPSSVTTIENRAFYNAGVSASNNLTITGCENVESIGNAAFSNSSVVSLDLPKVKMIGKRAFSNCSKLVSLTLHNSQVVETNVDDVSNDINKNNNVLFGSTKFTIYVPQELVAEYKNAFGWSAYATRISAIEV